MQKQPFQQTWHILGVGAIGSLWAALLSAAGQKVTLISRNRQAQQRLLEHGLTLEEGEQLSHFSARAELPQESSAPLANLLVCCKSIDTLSALEPLASRIDAGTLLILLQNGMGQQQQVSDRYPLATLICGITTDGAWRRSANHIVRAGRGVTQFGLFNKAGEHNRTARIADMQAQLLGVDADIEWPGEITPLLWHKLAINACINPLTAIKRCRNGALLNDPESLSLMRVLCQETARVMHGSNIAADADELFRSVIEVIGTTADNYSSMHQDINNGRESEIGYINGFICQLAEKLNIRVPCHQSLLQSVVAMY